MLTIPAFRCQGESDSSQQESGGRKPVYARRYAKRQVSGAVRAQVPPAFAPAVATVVVTVALAVALGACRGSGDAPSVSPAASGARPHAAVARDARPTRRCSTADLSVAPASRTTKQGLDIARFSVTTAATDGCILAGVPNLRPKGLLSPQAPGATVDLAVSQQPVPDDVGLPAGDGGPVALLPGGAASFDLAWYSTSTVVCVQSNGFGFDAPGDTSYGDMKPVGYGIGPLCDGVFYVSPVF
jgi:hypothetical protein